MMAEAEWLADGERIALDGVDRVLIRGTDVEMMELMEVTATSEPSTEESNGRS